MSPGDRFDNILTKIADYEHAGIEFVFLADPTGRRLSRYRNGDLTGVPSLELPAYAVSIPLIAIFD